MTGVGDYRAKSVVKVNYRCRLAAFNIEKRLVCAVSEQKVNG